MSIAAVMMPITAVTMPITAVTMALTVMTMSITAVMTIFVRSSRRLHSSTLLFLLFELQVALPMPRRHKVCVESRDG